MFRLFSQGQASSKVLDLVYLAQFDIADELIQLMHLILQYKLNLIDNNFGSWSLQRFTKRI